MPDQGGLKEPEEMKEIITLPTGLQKVAGRVSISKETVQAPICIPIQMISLTTVAITLTDMAIRPQQLRVLVVEGGEG